MNTLLLEPTAPLHFIFCITNNSNMAALQTELDNNKFIPLLTSS